MNVGKFAIKTRMIWEYPEKVMKIMGNCIVHEVHNNFGSAEIVYYAQSPLFDIDTKEIRFDEYPTYYFAVDGDNILIQITPFEFLGDFSPAKCELTGKTENLFPYEFDAKKMEPKYRVSDAINDDDFGKEYHHIFTGEKIVIGEWVKWTSSNLT